MSKNQLNLPYLDKKNYYYVSLVKSVQFGKFLSQYLKLISIDFSIVGVYCKSKVIFKGKQIAFYKFNSENVF